MGNGRSATRSGSRPSGRASKAVSPVPASIPSAALASALTAFSDEYLPSGIRETPEWQAVLSAAGVSK